MIPGLRGAWLAAAAAVTAAVMLAVTPVPAAANPSPADTAASARLARAEIDYADWLDATAAVATIDSGLLTRIDGRNRRAWERRRVRLTAALDLALARIDATALGAEDADALRAMRKGLRVNALDASDSTPGHCADRSDAARSAGDSDPTALQVDLYACFEEIGNHIPFEGRTLVRTTALDLLQVLDDPGRRRRLFLALEPLWSAVNAQDDPDSPYRRMMVVAAAQAQRNGGTPIDDAAATLGISNADIERWLTDILDAWRQHLPGPPIEPWNYWYAAAGAARELAPLIPRASVLPISERFYHDLGADLNGLGIRHDLDVRPGKAPLAYADHVRIGRLIGTRWRPAIPRVSANYEQGGLFVLNELIHEDGHAVHDAALRTRPAFYSMGDDLFVEAFADVPSWSTFEPAWQQKYLGRATDTRASLRALYANVMLDVAWGLFELRMLKEPASDPNAVWTGITSRYLNIAPHPELSWWALRVQLVRWPGYMINYGLGAVLTADIRSRTAEAIGSFATGNARWYAWTSEHLLRYGTSLDTQALLRQFLGRPVDTAALLNQLQRLD